MSRTHPLFLSPFLSWAENPKSLDAGKRGHIHRFPVRYGRDGSPNPFLGTPIESFRQSFQGCPPYEPHGRVGPYGPTGGSHRRKYRTDSRRWAVGLPEKRDTWYDPLHAEKNRSNTTRLYMPIRTRRVARLLSPIHDQIYLYLFGRHQARGGNGSLDQREVWEVCVMRKFSLGNPPPLYSSPFPRSRDGK